jgi:predicted S18 family serine protease
MSKEEVKKAWGETVRSVKELVQSVSKATHDELSRTAPKVANTLDNSFKQASKDLENTLRAIDEKSTKEQLHLLTAWDSFLQKQREMLDAKIRRLRERMQS